MISAPVRMIWGPEDHPGHALTPPDASRTLHVPKTLKFCMFLRSEELLFKTSHRLPRGQNVCISEGNKNDWGKNQLLQTEVTVAFCAREGQIILIVRMISS